MENAKTIEERTDWSIIVIDTLIYAEQQYANGKWKNWTCTYEKSNATGRQEVSDA